MAETRDQPFSFFKSVLHKGSTVPEHLIFLLLEQYFLQKLNNIFLTIQYRHPRKNREVNEKQMKIFKTRRFPNTNQGNTPYNIFLRTQHLRKH